MPTPVEYDVVPSQLVMICYLQRAVEKVQPPHHYTLW